MRFEVAPELTLFAESVRGVLAGWEPPVPTIGEWSDERDDVLAARLAELGWKELWRDVELLGPTVAGALELGRLLAPLHLVDEATLGAPLAVDGRVRHGEGRSRAAVLVAGGGLVLVQHGELRREPALDAVGTLAGLEPGGLELPEDDAAARRHAWSAATLGYLAGLAGVMLDRTVDYVHSREQFGAPLGALPTMQARLADAAVARDSLELVAWSAASGEHGDLRWAGRACRDVTASALQAHGAIGFALESGLHRYYRRAKTVQVWADATKGQSFGSDPHVGDEPRV